MAIIQPRVQRADTSGLRFAPESPLKSLAAGLTTGINLAMKMKEQSRIDEVHEIEKAKINKALDNQKRRDAILSNKDLSTSEREDALIRIGDVKTALELSKFEQKRKLRATEEAQAKADLAKTEAETSGAGATERLREAQTKDIATDNARAMDKLKADKDDDVRRGISSINNPVLQAQAIVDNRHLYNLSDDTAGKAVDIAKKTVQAKLTAKKGKGARVSAKPADVDRFMAKFDDMGWDTPTLGIGGFFANDINRSIAAQDAAGLSALYQSNRDMSPPEADALAMELVKAASSGGVYNAAAAADMITQERALQAKTDGVQGITSVPQPDKVQLVKDIAASNGGKLPQNAREQWDSAHPQYPADAMARSDKDMIEEARSMAPSMTEWNNKVTREFVKDEPVAPAGVITKARTEATKKAQGLGEAPSDVDLRKDITSRKRIIGKLENQKAVAKSKVGAKGTPETLAARKEIRRLDAQIKKQRKLLSDITPTGSEPSPKVESSVPLTTKQQTEAVLSQATTGNPPEVRSRETFSTGMAASESTGDPTIIVGNESAGTHKMGLYQFGIPRLKDLGYISKGGKWTGKNGIRSQDDFLNSPEEQTVAFNAHVIKLEAALKNSSQNRIALDALVGGKIDGVKITKSGLVGASHLLGGGSKERIGVRNAMRKALPKRILNAPDSAKEIARKKLTPEEKRATQIRFKKLLVGSKDDFGTSGWDYVEKFKEYY